MILKYPVRCHPTIQQISEKAPPIYTTMPPTTGSATRERATTRIAANPKAVFPTVTRVLPIRCFGLGGSRVRGDFSVRDRRRPNTNHAISAMLTMPARLPARRSANPNIPNKAASKAHRTPPAIRHRPKN